jgi:hypothetical protein
MRNPFIQGHLLQTLLLVKPKHLSEQRPPPTGIQIACAVSTNWQSMCDFGVRMHLDQLCSKHLHILTSGGSLHVQVSSPLGRYAPSWPADLCMTTKRLQATMVVIDMATRNSTCKCVEPCFFFYPAWLLCERATQPVYLSRTLEFHLGPREKVHWSASAATSSRARKCNRC